MDAVACICLRRMRFREVNYFVDNLPDNNCCSDLMARLRLWELLAIPPFWRNPPRRRPQAGVLHMLIEDDLQFMLFSAPEIQLDTGFMSDFLHSDTQVQRRPDGKRQIGGQRQSINPLQGQQAPRNCLRNQRLQAQLAFCPYRAIHATT